MRIINKYKALPIAARATLWFMICSTLQKCISLLTTPIFTRLMSTTQYGQYSIYNSWLQILTIITTLRLNFAVFNKGMSKYKESRDAYTSTMQTTTFMITVLIFGVYIIFHSQINSIIELPTFIMIAIFVELLFTPAIDFWTIRKRYEYIYKPVVLVTISMTFLNAVIGILFVYFSREKGYARIFSCVLVNILFGVVIFAYNRKKGKIWFKWEFAKFAILFNLPLLIHYISLYVLDQFDRIMIQRMVGLSAAGIYSVAYNAGLMVKIITQSINSAIVPWQYDKLEKKKYKEIDTTTFLIFVLIGCCVLLFIAFAPEIIMFLAGNKYYEAIYVIPPVALSTFFTFAYTIFANVEFYYEQNQFTMYVSLAGAIINIALNYFGIKLFGYIAAAYTTLICYMLFTTAHYIYMVYSVKKSVGVCNVFSAKRVVLLSLILLLAGAIIIYLYDKFILRYLMIIVFMIFAIIKRSVIKDILKNIKSK